MNAEYRITSHESRATRDGFSLMEVLLAVGTLAVGMLFIAGVFPVGIHFTTVATERTTAAIVADEAFAKIKLLGLLDATNINWSAVGQTPFEFVAKTQPATDYFAYPSTHTNFMQKKYFWSAVCRRLSQTDFQVTVFISRKAGMTSKYYKRKPLPPPPFITNDIPVPVFVSVTSTGRPDELLINDPLNLQNFINVGYTIVDNATGNIYRVLQRTNTVVQIDKAWAGLPPQGVWTVPASASVTIPATIGRYPCIAVYQKVMRF